MYRKTNQQKKDDEDDDSIECPNLQCMQEFHSRSELEAHLNVIGHHSPAEKRRRGLYDTLRIDWVRRFQNISLDGKQQTRHESKVESTTATEDRFLKMEWALHKPRGGQTRFSDKVRVYQQKKFEIGLERSRKEEPSQVASDMRKAPKAENSRLRKNSPLMKKTVKLTIVLPRNMHAKMMSNWPGEKNQRSCGGSNWCQTSTNVRCV